MVEARRTVKRGFLFKLVLAPILMFFFAYGLVPLYDVLCDITGFNGRTGVVANEKDYKVDINRKVLVNFFAATAPGFAVDFKPELTQMQIVPGQFYTMNYIARNRTNETIIGQAIPSVAPTDAAAHFKKLECFCFNRQVFLPKQDIKMAVRFVVEPAMKDTIKDVSLSYNFFRLDKEKK